MRTSKRTEILEAATRVVEREGIKSLTYDSVAAEAGLTKGGLLYHFASREDLVVAVHQHLAALWESGMVESAGKPVGDTSPEERHAAYARVNTDGASRAELLFIIESSTTPEHAAPWDSVMERWAPPTPPSTAGAAELDRFIARLAADGLWMFESLTSERLDPKLRRAVAERLAEKIELSE